MIAALIKKAMPVFPGKRSASEEIEHPLFVYLEVTEMLYFAFTGGQLLATSE